MREKGIRKAAYGVSFGLSALVGWFGVAASIDHKAVSETPEVSRSDRITLLGGDVSGKARELKLPRRFEQAKDMLSRLEAAGPEELKQWLVQLEGDGSSEEFINMIVAQLATFDPKGAVAFLGTKQFLERYRPIALMEWARVDSKTAVAEALALGPGGEVAFHMMYSAEAELRQEIYDELVNEGFDEAHPLFFQQFFAFLSEDDPLVEAERTLDFIKRTGITDAFGNSIGDWYRKDPEKAMQWVMDMDDPELRQKALSSFAFNTMRVQGAEGMDEVWEHLDKDHREKFIQEFRGTHGDINQLLDWVDEKLESPELYGTLVTNLVGNLASSDQPEQMAEILNRLDTDFITAGRFRMAVENVSLKWAEQDLEAFQVWMNSLEDPEVKQLAEKGFLTYWAREDPKKVLEFWQSNPENVETVGNQTSLLFYYFISNAADVIGTDDPRAVLEHLPEGLQDQAAGAYAWMKAQDAPAEAMAFLDSLPPSESIARHSGSVLDRWIHQAPDEAAAWIGKLEEGTLKEDSVKRLMNKWNQIEPVAAEEWMTEEPLQ